MTMSRQVPAAVLAISATLLLAGCASSASHSASALAGSTSTTSSSVSVSTTPAPPVSSANGYASPSIGLITPDAKQVDDGGGAATAAAPALAKMVCGPEIKAAVAQALGVSPTLPTTPVWADPVYTCRYQLAQGPLILSVAQSSNDDTAAQYFERQKARLPDAADAIGLGEKSFANPNGITVVIKDNLVLTVDATGLPPVFGTNGQKRTDFSYEIASDVMGCWTGTW
jgi:hypothetical protein